MTKIEYFAIDTRRLIFLSIITLGLYSLYWFYRNWKAVKEAEKSDIYPFWRAIFSIFFCYSLFKRILNSATEKGYDKKYSPGFLATVYILSGFSSSRLHRYDTPLVSFISLLLFIAVIAIFVRVQRTINYHHQQLKEGNELTRSFARGEVIVIVLGVLLFLATLFI